MNDSKPLDHIGPDLRILLGYKNKKDIYRVYTIDIT